MTHSELIKIIEDHADSCGIAPATVTSRAVGNSRLYKRLKTGGSCTIEIAERISAFIHKQSEAAGR